LLTKQDIKRYSRQLGLSQIEEQGQQNIMQSHVVVIGLGGLGTLASRYLVGAGVGKITLIDGDVVDMSNLQRQIAYNEMHLGELKAKALCNELKKVNPHTTCNYKSLFVDSNNLPTLLSNATCVLDCTDSVATRQQINHACIASSIPLFMASASGVTWQAINISSQVKNTGCYACLVEHITLQEDCISQGVLGPAVGMAACHQAAQALLFLSKRYSADIQWGRYLNCHVAQGAMQSFSLLPSSHCEVCQ
jgi:sulfur carrier protein ThiS adenylyltransferase/adenylyltransferase/sulfurtransferase